MKDILDELNVLWINLYNYKTIIFNILYKLTNTI